MSVKKAIRAEFPLVCAIISPDFTQETAFSREIRMKSPTTAPKKNMIGGQTKPKLPTARAIRPNLLLSAAEILQGQQLPATAFTHS